MLLMTSLDQTIQGEVHGCFDAASPKALTETPMAQPLGALRLDIG